MIERRLALLLLLTLIAPTLAAEQVLEDPAGDIAAELRGQALPWPTDQQPTVDLRALVIEEEEDGFWFRLGLEDIPETGAFFQHFAQIEAWFRYAGIEHQIVFVIDYDITTNPWLLVYLDRCEVRGTVGTEQDCTFLTDLPAHAEGTEIVTFVSRDLILGKDRTAPFQGSRLEELWVQSVYVTTRVTGDGEVGIHVHDEMPDQDAGGPYPVKFGVPQTGHARLHSSGPMRALETRPATLLYHVTAENLAAEPDQFLLRLGETPTGWIVRVPEGSVALKAHERVDLPVLVQVPAAEDAPSEGQFIVELHSANDPDSIGRVALGTAKPDLPLPGPDHSILWLHSRDAGYGDLTNLLDTAVGQEEWHMIPFLSTAEDDDRDEGLAVPGQPWGLYLYVGEDEEGRLLHQEYHWNYGIDPSLQQGLAFDPTKPLHLELPVSTTLPTPKASLWASLTYHAVEETSDGRESRERVLAAGRSPTLLDIGPTTTEVFTLEMEPTRYAGYIPYTPTATLELEFNLTIERYDTLLGPRDRPTAQPGGFLTLPLLPYEDDISGVVSDLTKLTLTPTSAVERLVNPGKTARFSLSVANLGMTEDTIQLSIAGLHKDWAKLVGPSRMILSPDESREFAVAVTIPPDAADGQMADLIVRAASTQIASQSSSVRIRALVNSTLEMEDETLAFDGDDRLLPGAPLAGVAVALAVLATSRRRHP